LAREREGKASHSPDGVRGRQGVSIGFGTGATMQNGADRKKKTKCKNCEGKGLIKNGDKKVKCQRCGGTGFKASTPAY
jgi:DnaJ-class molecular chaperone